LAKIYQRLGREQKAKEYAKLAIERQPLDKEAKQILLHDNNK